MSKAGSPQHKESDGGGKELGRGSHVTALELKDRTSA